jgi:hypothetical protein
VAVSQLRSVCRDAMRSLIQLLSHLPACNTRSAHSSTIIEDTPHLHSLNSSPDPPPSPPNQDKVLPAALMSFHPYTVTHYSYLQSCFDHTLIEYTKVTGIDLITHPIVTTLGDCNRVDAVIAAIQDHSRSNDSSIDSSLAETIIQLNSTLQTVLWLSPNDALCDYIDLVGHSMLGSCLIYVYTITHALQLFTPSKAIFASICILIVVCSHLHSGASI